MAQDADRRSIGDEPSAELQAAQARIATLEQEITAYHQELDRLLERVASLERLANVGAEGVLIHREGVVIDANQSVADILRMSVETVLGHSVFDFVAPEDRERAQKMMQSGSEQHYDLLALRADGTTLPVEIITRNLGSPRLRAVLVRDLAARKEAEEILRRREERYRMLADNATDVIWTLDREGRFTYVSPSVERLRGYTPEEVMEQSFDEALVPESARIAQMGLETLLAQDAGSPGEVLAERFELEQPCKDGSTVWTEVTTSIIYDDEGRFHSVLGVSRDISERRRIQQALDRERTLLRTLIDALPDYVYVKDEHGRFLLNNAASITSLGAESQLELIGKSDRDFFPAETVDRWEHDEQYILRSGKPLLNYEEHVRASSGATYIYLTSKFPRYDRDGKPSGIIGITRDVTAHRRLERDRLTLELERERLSVLGQFIGDASHDLRTPLTSMKVSLAVLSRLVEGEKARQHLNILKTQTDRLEYLFDDLLDMSRLARTLNLDLKQYEVNDLVRSVVYKYEQQARRKSHRVHFVSLAGPLYILADVANLSRALGALLSNALMYTPRGGAITIEVEQQLDQVVVVVQDTGVGIDPQDLSNIFKPLYRVDPARSASNGGMGLGLSIAQKIVELHNGRITVESTPGYGSVFRVFLPLIEDPDNYTARRTDE